MQILYPLNDLDTSQEYLYPKQPMRIHIAINSRHKITFTIYPSPHDPYALVTQNFHRSFKCATLIVTIGPVHWLSPLLEILFPQIFTWLALSYHLRINSNVTSSSSKKSFLTTSTKILPPPLLPDSFFHGTFLKLFSPLRCLFTACIFSPLPSFSSPKMQSMWKQGYFFLCSVIPRTCLIHRRYSIHFMLNKRIARKLYPLPYRMWATGEFYFSLQHSVPYHDSGRFFTLFFF